MTKTTVLITVLMVVAAITACYLTTNSMKLILTSPADVQNAPRIEGEKNTTIALMIFVAAAVIATISIIFWWVKKHNNY